MVIMKFLPVLLAVALAGTALNPSINIENKPANLKISFNDVMEIIGGVFVGMALDVNAQDVAPCVADIGNMGLELEQAFHYYMLKTYTGKVKALALLSLVYKQLPKFMKDCKAGGLEEVEAIERMVLAFGHPLSVLSHMGENLVVNGADIMDEVSFAMGAWEFKQYFDFGFYCGEAAFKILYVPPKKPSVDSAAAVSIIQGLAKSINYEIQVNDLSEEVVKTLEESLSQDYSFSGIADSLRMIGEGVEKACKEAELENGLGKLISSALNILKEPTSLLVHNKLIMLNGVSLDDYIPIIVNFKNSDWENVGYYIGETINTLSQALSL